MDVLDRVNVRRASRSVAAAAHCSFSPLTRGMDHVATTDSLPPRTVRSQLLAIIHSFNAASYITLAPPPQPFLPHNLPWLDGPPALGLSSSS